MKNKSALKTLDISDPAVKQKRLGAELRSAAADANPLRLKDLIEAGADVNYLGVIGQPALCPLIFKFFDERISRNDVEKYIQCLGILLSAGANPNLGSPAPFELAAELRNRAVLNLLIDGGANVNAVYMPSGMTPLHLTLLPLEDGRVVDAGCAIDLIKAGAHLAARDSSGQLPMHLASKCGLLPELQEILNRRPQDINELDNDGLTSIMLAAGGGHEEAVKVLLSFGAKSSDNLNETLLAAPQDKQDLERARSEDDLQISELAGDDAAYLKWARDIGSDLEVQTPNLEPENDDDYVPSERSQIDNWFEEFYVPVIDALWEKYVPKSGACTVLQGELSRCIGRLEGELFKNGMMNMGDGYYDRMVDMIKEAVLKDGKFSPLVHKVMEKDALVVKGADYSEIVNTISFFHPTDVEVSLNRMKMVVAAWCVANPVPIEFTSSELD
jgi:ankyrin repeat protein